MSDEVKPPSLRGHNYYYRSPKWTVVDVENIDRCFAIESAGTKVRIDVDGTATGTSEVGDAGDRVNVSFWIAQDDLREALADAGVLDE